MTGPDLLLKVKIRRKRLVKTERERMIKVLQQMLVEI
jgi:hypothetical protein